MSSKILSSGNGLKLLTLIEEDGFQKSVRIGWGIVDRNK